jgi:hypothetical protein
MGDNITVGYDELILKSYLAILAKMRKELDMKMPPSFIIFDDLIGSLVSSQNSKMFMSLITTFRHYNVSVFICAQYARGLINPTLREQARYVFCTNSGGENTDHLYKSFGNKYFKNKNQMADVLVGLNGSDDEEDSHYNEKSHNFLVMDTTKTGIKSCFTVEAPEFEPKILIAKTKKAAPNKHGKKFSRSRQSDSDDESDSSDESTDYDD